MKANAKLAFTIQRLISNAVGLKIILGIGKYCMEELRLLRPGLTQNSYSTFEIDLPYVLCSLLCAI
jgi:hypothetical protein